MSMSGAFFGANIGAVVGTFFLGPAGTAIGGKVGALIGSGGNPLSLIGIDGLDGVEASADPPSDIHGNPNDQDGYGNRPGDIYGRPPSDTYGNPR